VAEQEWAPADICVLWNDWVVTSWGSRVPEATVRRLEAQANPRAQEDRDVNQSDPS